MSKKQWNRRRRSHDRKPQPAAVDTPPCPICSKPLRFINSAIMHNETNQAAHFDCVLKSIRQTVDLQPNEKICYLGKGSFGVIQLRNPNSPMRFFIRQRIQYEAPDNKPEWRNDIIKDLIK